MERKNKIEQLKHDSILSCLEFLNFEDLLSFAICNKNCYKYVYKLIHQRKNPGLTKYIEQCLKDLIENGCTKEEAIKTITRAEPGYMHPDLIGIIEKDL